MITDVKKFIHKHHLLKENKTVLVGVSGGPDSMALLHLLISMKEQWNLHVIALAVDHQLRGSQSRSEVQYVKDMCNEWGVRVVTISINVRSYQQEQQVSTQVAARNLRYQFFKEQMDVFDADYLALGHHGDDQVETMFMTMTRSASSSALSGIPAKRPFASGFIIRPLLSVTKAHILSYCQQHHIQPRFDPSNENMEDMRVWFREKIVPLIKEKNRNIHTTIQHLSETLSEDEKLLQSEAKRLVDNIIHFHKNGKYASFKISQFRSYAHALQRRAFHLILNYLYDGNIPNHLSYVHEYDFFSLLANEQGTLQIDFPNELIIEQSYGTASLYFQKEKVVQPVDMEIQVPGTTEMPDGSKVIAQVVSDIDRMDMDKYTYICDKETVALPLHIRTRQAGDRIRWEGLNGSKKLKDIFIDEKVPRNERDTWPVVVDHRGEVLWVIGIKKGKPARLTNSTTSIILHYEKGNRQG